MKNYNWQIYSYQYKAPFSKSDLQEYTSIMQLITNAFNALSNGFNDKLSNCYLCESEIMKTDSKKFVETVGSVMVQ